MIRGFMMNFYDNRSLLDKIKRIYKPYKKFGLIYSKKDGTIYFKGKLVREFYDEKNNLIDIFKAGECNVKAVYDSWGSLIELREY